MTFTLTQEQYEALISLARKGATDQIALDSFLRSIEKTNNITRYALWVQWQELNSPLPPTANFPEAWPPNLRFYLENLTRPIAKVDVQAVLTQKASQPTSVLVTRDPAGLVGWTPIDQFFVT